MQYAQATYMYKISYIMCLRDARAPNKMICILAYSYRYNYNTMIFERQKGLVPCQNDVANVFVI